MTISSYRDLIVWQKSIDLVVEIYSLVKTFPKEELYGLTSQMKRSAVSIPSNIAEGSKRGSKKDYRHFLLNAFGSGAELETQIIIAQKLNLATEQSDTVSMLLNEIMRMLNKMISELGEA